MNTTGNYKSELKPMVITFEELYAKMKDEMPYNCPMHMKPYVKQLAEIYAKSVATHVLKDAAENAELKLKRPYDGTAEVDKESITNTKIETP